ncbi:MAG: hypothetical protein FWD17_11265, partial [Polyangiaceae bacterium]|nr:hypothetical protein [Polyangiaceae bacterium]
PPGADADGLRYQKYALPEEPFDEAEASRRLTPEMTPQQPLIRSHHPGSSAPQGLGSTIVFSPASNLMPPPRLGSMRDAALGNGTSVTSRRFEEEQIDIPGTHVPRWVVAIIVVAVILVLLGTAFLLLG